MSIASISPIKHPQPKIESDVVTKFCTKCNHQHPLTDFHKDKTSKDGLYSSCKICKNSGRVSTPSQSEVPTPIVTALEVPYDQFAHVIERQCTICGNKFAVSKTGKNRTVCGDCQQKNKLPASKVHNIRSVVDNEPFRPSAINLLPPDELQKVFEHAVLEVINRHVVEFRDICVTEAERIPKNKKAL